MHFGRPFDGACRQTLGRRNGFIRITAAVVLLACLPCAAQIAYRNVKPGTSTRADVDRTFGQPVSQPSQTLAEYAPPQPNLRKMYVQYRSGSELVERMELLFTAPIERVSLRQRVGLKAPVSTRVDNAGRLTEYYGPAESVVLTYEGSAATSGVNRIGFYSAELFTSASAGATPYTGGDASPTQAAGATPPPSLSRTGETSAANNTGATPSLGGRPMPSGTLANDTDFRVRLLSPLSTKTSNKGDKITAQVLHPPEFNGDFLEGTVRSSKGGGKVKGTSVLNFSFDTLHHGNQAVRVRSQVKSLVNSKGQENVDEEGQLVRKKNNLAKIGAATAIGAVIGGLAGGGKGAVIGAGVGAAAGLVLVEVAVEGANVTLAPGSEFVLSVRSAETGQQ
jgi:hypothetical protein